MSVFWLGPVGAMRALPSPALGSGPDATGTRFGAVHRSLNGRPTVDRLGVKRTWTLTWPYLDTDTAAYLDAIHLGLINGPLWLIDPQRVNRADAQTASAGTTTHNTDGFTTTAGSLIWSPALRPDAPVDGGIRWTLPATDARLDAVTRVPVPTTQAVTFSAWLSGTRPVRLTLTAEDATGSTVTTRDGPLITPGPAGIRAGLTLPPTPGVAACRAAITSPADIPTTVSTAAWQVEAAALPTAWRPGGGAAVVVLDSLQVTYPVPGSYATTVTLLEV